MAKKKEPEPMPSEQVKKPHLSASQVNMYNRCPEQYRRRYIEKHVIPPGSALIRGTAVHAGAEYNFTQKMETKVDLPASQVVERAVDAVEQKVKHEGLELNENEKAEGKEAVVGRIIDQSRDLSLVMMERVAPGIQPVGVEEKVRIEMPSASRDLLAILDIRTADTVEDFKTGAKLKGKKNWEGDTQMAMYSLTHRALTGKDPRTVRVHELVAAKTPKAETHDLNFGMSDYEPLLRRINATLKGIDAGHFPPTATGAWWCSQSWCGYWNTCPYVNGERKAAAESSEK